MIVGLIILTTFVGLFAFLGLQTNKDGRQDSTVNNLKIESQMFKTEIYEILMNVSSQINQGKQSLKPVGRINKMKAKSFGSINKSAILVQKNLKSLGYLRNSVETDPKQIKVK